MTPLQMKTGAAILFGQKAQTDSTELNSAAPVKTKNDDQGH